MMRSEYPNPQFEREKWINLNGTWEFEIDNSNSGHERGYVEKEHLNGDINVPFCPESKLSGIENKDFMLAVWYKKQVNLRKTGERIILHFGAVDYLAKVYLNGTFIGKHIGGYASFSFDITDAAKDGENIITVYAYDDVRSGKQPRGKQSGSYQSMGCDYTRTTGIWQTVWIEFVPKYYIKNVKYQSDIANQCVYISGETCGDGEIIININYLETNCGKESVIASGGRFYAMVKLNQLHLWELGDGKLYDVTFNFGQDTVKSYFGMREVTIDGLRFLLNGKSVFQRLVLDQGFYIEGIYTAPTDEDLIKDIEISMNLGFNGARLHQKVFEQRFLYHCDRLGYMVWGEYGNWGLDVSDIGNLPDVVNEWSEIVKRDFNSPSLIGWCPFNETWDYNGRRQNDKLIETLYKVTKSLDNTRPCIDTSGNFHVLTDIYDLHNYRQNVEEFAACYNAFGNGGEFTEEHPHRQHYTQGMPLFISEYGGIKWDDKNENIDAWGYGDAPNTPKEFIERYKGLTNALLDNKNIMGFCYTQLYDIEQEVNGLCYYDRSYKFDPQIFREINSRKATIEEESA